jgi:UMF1 family MFS transporter
MFEHTSLVVPGTDLHQAFWFLAVLIGLPFPIMMLVNVERGREEGTALALKLEELGRARDEASEQSSLLREELRDGEVSYQRS